MATVNWYVKAGDEAVEGPIGIADLCRRAQEGRVRPGDKVSTDGEIWLEAFDLPDLQEIASASPRPAERRPPTSSPARVNAVDEQPRVAAEGQAASGSAQAPEVEWGATKEAGRWRHLHEKDQQQSAKSREILKKRIRELEEEDARNLQSLEQLRLDTHRLRQSYERLQEAARTEPDQMRRVLAAATEQSSALQNSYEALLQSYDVLFKQLGEKTREVDAMAGQRAQAERSAEERIRALDEQLAKERELTGNLRQRLEAMERECEQITRAFRDLNRHMVESRR